MPHPYQVLVPALDQRFPDWNNLGGHVCRPKRGSTTSWSDHAYMTPHPHALDIGVPDLSAPYADRLAWGDAVSDWLHSIGLGRLGIRYYIWRDGGVHEGHHLHVSFQPSQHNKQPSCDGGPADLPAPNIDYLEDTMHRRPGAHHDVKLLQVALNYHLEDDAVVDGIWGPVTSAGVRSLKERVNVRNPDTPVGDDGDSVAWYLFADWRQKAGDGNRIT